LSGPSPCSISLRAWSACCADSSRLRPIRTPRAIAAARPAFVRSCINDRSSSASIPTICHMARPVGVSVSIASVSDWKATPCAFRLSSRAIRSRNDRPSRSSFQTVRTSPALRALRHFASAGRLAFAPVAVSVNILPHPAPREAIEPKGAIYLILVFCGNPRIAYFHGLFLSLAYGTAKPLISRARVLVSKILIYGAQDRTATRAALSRLAGLLRDRGQSPRGKRGPVDRVPCVPVPNRATSQGGCDSGLQTLVV